MLKNDILADAIADAIYEEMKKGEVKGQPYGLTTLLGHSRTFRDRFIKASTDDEKEFLRLTALYEKGFQKTLVSYFQDQERAALSVVKSLADIEVKGGPGSGSWDGPGRPRFAHEGGGGFLAEVKLEKGPHHKELYSEIDRLFRSYPDSILNDFIQKTPLEISVVKKFKNEDRYGETAFSSKADGAITIKIAEANFSHEKGEPSMADHTLRHELGHYIEMCALRHKEILYDKIESQFKAADLKNVKYPREMKFNHREYFAESFARFSSKNAKDVSSVPKEMSVFLKGSILKGYPPGDTKSFSDITKASPNALPDRFNFEDWTYEDSKWNERLAKEGGLFIKSVYEREGKRVWKGLQNKVGDNLVGSFDLDNPEWYEFIDEYPYWFAQQVNAQTVEMLRNSVALGFSAGESMAGIAARIKDVFDVCTRYRSLLIARTETIRASNGAATMAYQQSGVVSGKEWLTTADDRLCSHCAEMNGKIVDVDKTFFDKGDTFTVEGVGMKLDYEDVAHPPLHPNCRCALVAVIADEYKGTEGTLLKGGSGSGNFGHSGRPGKVGGSGAGESAVGIKDKPIKDKPFDDALKYASAQYRGLTSKEITHGHCYEWAGYVKSKCPEVAAKEVDLWKHRGKQNLPYHVWVEYKGKAYDAEHLNGVSSWKELNYFKEHSNQIIISKLSTRVVPGIKSDSHSMKKQGAGRKGRPDSWRTKMRPAGLSAFIKGGPGSGSWEGPGQPRFAHDASGSISAEASTALGKMGVEESDLVGMLGRNDDNVKYKVSVDHDDKELPVKVEMEWIKKGADDSYATGSFRIPTVGNHKDYLLADYLDIAQEDQANSMGTELMGRVLNFAQKAGKKGLIIYADISIGRYAWAKKGFEYEDPKQIKESRAGLKKYVADVAKTFQIKIDKKFVTERIDSMKSVRDIATFELPNFTFRVKDLKRFVDFSNDDVPGKLKVEIGKAFMLDDNGHGDWNGVLNFARG